MIYSVFCPGAANPELPWQPELLGYSWGRARQPGELVHLVSKKPGNLTACHPLARVVETQRWSPHPYTGDLYPPYQTAAGVFEWLFVEEIAGTVLLLEPTSVFRSPVSQEVSPGQAQATAWPDLPRGAGPFGLGPGFEFLANACLDPTLELAAVSLPVLIHASDLRKIAVRWLELMSIIRAETFGRAQGPTLEAARIAYVIAAAEARIPHAVADLGAGTSSAESRADDDPQGAAPILDYRRPLTSTDGTVVWDPASYRNWDPVQPDAVAPGRGRDFLALLSEYLERRAQGLDLSLLKPCRERGVREGKILGAVFLEIPGRADTVSLNSSGAAIWEACDGTRSLAEINHALETRFAMPAGSLRPDVEVVIKRLEDIGALRLARA